MHPPIQTDKELHKKTSVLLQPAVMSDIPVLMRDFKAFPALGNYVVLVRDEDEIEPLLRTGRFFRPDLRFLPFPAWDVEPFDRLSPHIPLVHERVRTLVSMGQSKPEGLVVVTTLQAFMQRVAPPEYWQARTRTLRPGERQPRDELIRFLLNQGYHRVETVRECGEFAVRGHLLDIFSPYHEAPIRVDFWDDQIETLSFFDPLLQQKKQVSSLYELIPCHELLASPEVIEFFQQQLGLSGGDQLGVTSHDIETLKRGIRPLGIERYLPLFHTHMANLFDYMPKATVVTEYTFQATLRHISNYQDSQFTQQGLRSEALRQMYLSAHEATTQLHQHPLVLSSPLALSSPERLDQPQDDVQGLIDISADQPSGIQPLAGPWPSSDPEVWQKFVDDAVASQHHVIWAYSSDIMHQKAHKFLSQQGLEVLDVESWEDLPKRPERSVILAPMSIPASRCYGGILCIAEQDVFGRKTELKLSSKKRADAALLEVAQLAAGDYVVHAEHGIGRFEGLVSITVLQQPHDCVQLTYEGGDKLFVPVENIEVISRYGSQELSPQLDKLGAVSWQHRKAKVKAKIFAIADHLVKVAAERQLIESAPVHAAQNFEAFCDRFPFQETDDQLRAQDDILHDLSQPHPMDRLICGDVGFGKTEIALRAAFLVAAAGGQVVVVAPTTLLCRQHFETFKARFEGFPFKISQLSRFVSTKDAAQVRAELVSGQTHILITTHAVFAKSTHFKDLRFLIIDEEHHFGVKQKEKLKEQWPSIHVLTLTATPIPRTLQMSMVGIREMSLIATPPVDRQAVQIHVLPFDPRALHEAILREKRRGGQVFLVSPRIADLEDLQLLIDEHVPEVRSRLVHGQMPAATLDDVMLKFREGDIDVLISTSIVESGIDIPTANTILIHRADLFGLAQLYQLRGRVGRSKIKGYAYLFLPAYQLNSSAIRRLEAMQTLDGLGAGFTLASHDLDIRGAGNLVGAEQSGYIREVGAELYQHMLEAAIAALKEGHKIDVVQQGQSPQISLNMPVCIPETYVPDMGLRLGLYRRGAVLKSLEELQHFTVELEDRFGPTPVEVENLLTVLELKIHCMDLGIAKLDVGEKGIIVSFAKAPNLAKLLAFINDQKGTAKMRPDERLVLLRSWPSVEAQCQGLRAILLSMRAFEIAG